MAIFIVGGTGKTGRHLVHQLVEMGKRVKVVVRPGSAVPQSWSDNELITVIRLELTGIDANQLALHLADCDAIGSCLGHRTIFGPPYNLVSDTIGLLFDAAIKTHRSQPVRMVLMNTGSYHNPDSDPPLPLYQKLIVRILRLAFPPHSDHERTGAFLRERMGTSHPRLRWIAIRPDRLTNEKAISPYSVRPYPNRDPYFNPGKPSRINIGHFMATLLTDEASWQQWAGQMPVIYNTAS